jgi:hypothetical protein
MHSTPIFSLHPDLTVSGSVVGSERSVLLSALVPASYSWIGGTVCTYIIDLSAWRCSSRNPQIVNA